MTADEKIAYLTKAINTLRARGVVRNQGEFAALVGVNPVTISAAKKGNPVYLTDNLISRIEAIMDEHPSEKPKVQDNAQGNGVYIPMETVEMYTNMTATIDRLSRLVAELATDGRAKDKRGA